ncbi:branched-chain amino acid ABC transporter ATP-binding protein/permease [soil metagenome]
MGQGIAMEKGGKANYRMVLWGVPAVMLVAPLLLPDFYTTLLAYTGLSAIVVIGLVVLTGIGGITSFGQATFVGISAYTTGVLSTTMGWSPWASLVAALVLTCVAAAAIGLLTVRLSGHYLVLGTIAWSISLYYVFGNLSILGGYNGLSGVPSVSIFGYSLAGFAQSYYLIWGLALLVILGTFNLLDTRTGRAIRALRNPVLAESFGVDVYRMRLFIFIYAALLAAVAGWLQAHYLRFVNPTPFGFDASIEYAFMLVLGGATQVWGAVIGAFVLIVGKTGLQILLPKISPEIAHWDKLALGLMIVVLFHHARSGILSARSAAALRPRRKASDYQQAMPTAELQATPLLRVVGVTKRFGSLVAVNKVSFEVEPSQIVGVIGPNGAGKSTLFNLITGTLGVDEGAVWLGDCCITKLRPHDVVRHRVARTFQHVQLRPGQSVLDNVALGGHWLGRKGFIASLFHAERAEELSLKSRAMAAIERVGLADVAFDDAHSLSLGKQRIVEIARALTADPCVLLLDEPAAGLRYQEKVQLAELIRQLSDEGLTVLVVEHDMEFLMDLAHKIVVVNFGTKLCEGPPGRVQNDPQVVETYLGVES